MQTIDELGFSDDSVPDARRADSDFFLPCTPASKLALNLRWNRLPTLSGLEREMTVELTSIRYRTGLPEVKEDVLFILRRGRGAGLKLL
jgi:hypothetical protein